MTPGPLAAAIVAHFDPMGCVLEPCRGGGAFVDALHLACVIEVEWCEIADGRDFLTYDFGIIPFSWIISNPPWSQFRAFTKRAMQVADNVVWLAPINHFWLKARRRDMREAGFAIKEICEVDTPAKETGWPQSGFSLGAVHLQRGYTGPIIQSRL